MRVLVTGVTGFVGRILAETLAERGYMVRGAVRADRDVPPAVSEKVIVGDIGSRTDWSAALRQVDAVIHTAARAHIVGDSPSNAALYMETNAEGTKRLARAARDAGVRRFVYLSSVKVNGEETAERAYGANDEPHPRDMYGESKWAGEQHLKELCASSQMECVIVRSPLVYGPGVKANFLRLMRWVDRGVPLPLATVANRRSLVSLWNLTDFLVHTLQHPAAPGTWMVSDGEDVSTPDLIRAIAAAMRRPARLLPVPVSLLQFGGLLLGRRSDVARLCGSLTVDISATRAQLGWAPPLDARESIRRTVEWYLAAAVGA